MGLLQSITNKCLLVHVMLSQLSSLLGYCMVSFSFLTQVPQLRRIYREKKVDGLQLTSLLCELVGLVNGLALNWILGNPLSVYGELFPAIGQTFLLTYFVILLTYGDFWCNFFIGTFLILFTTIFLVQPFRFLWWISLPLTISILLAKVNTVVYSEMCSVENISVPADLSDLRQKRLRSALTELLPAWDCR